MQLQGMLRNAAFSWAASCTQEEGEIEFGVYKLTFYNLLQLVGRMFHLKHKAGRVSPLLKTLQSLHISLILKSKFLFMEYEFSNSDTCQSL